MRCFYVLVHGRLTWSPEAPNTVENWNLPAGFYCHRYVLAAHDEQAIDKAFLSVRENLDQQTTWLTRGLATVDLKAEEVDPQPPYKLLKRVNRGHTFYAAD